MKDIFKEFNRYTARKHLAIGVSAFAFAIGVNAFLMNTDTGVRLQTSAVEFAGGGNANAAKSADLTLVKGANGTDTVHLRLNKKAENVMEVDATLIMDPTSVEIANMATSDTNAEIMKNSNIPGVTLLMIRFKTPRTIEAGANVASLVLKKKKDTETPLNLASTRFIADGESYDLTNQGTAY